jgi:hypothetical protein
MRAAGVIGQTVDSGALLCYPSVTRTSLQDRTRVRVAAGTVAQGGDWGGGRGAHCQDTHRSLEQQAGSGREDRGSANWGGGSHQGAHVENLWSICALFKTHDSTEDDEHSRTYFVAV